GIRDLIVTGVQTCALPILGVAGVLGGLFVVVASVFGLIFGVFGIQAARQHRRPIALAVAGVFLNGIDILMWLGLLLCWIFAVVRSEERRVGKEWRFWWRR